MTKKINNHNIDSDDLLNRVKSGNTDGLDDFEKEAFEGFAALDNIELSKKLNSDLNKKIDEVYLKKTSEKSKFIYYAMAAGLVLVIGLSVVFLTTFTKQEDSLAYKPEAIEEVGDQLKNEVAKESAAETGVNSAEAVEAEPKKEPMQSPPTEKSFVPAAIADQKPAKDEDNRFGSEPAPRMVTKGPGAKTPAPVVAEEQKQNMGEIAAVAGKGADDKLGGGLMDNVGKNSNTRERDEKQPDDVNKEVKLAEVSSESNYKKQEESKAKKSSNKASDSEYQKNASQSVPAAMTKTEIAKGDKPERAKAASEKEGMDDLEAKHDESNAPKTTAASGVAAGDASATVSLRRSSFFKTAKFANHIDYIKTEIDKNEKLKTNIISYNKALRIDLTVSEKGKVTDAKATILQNKCDDCKEQLEKIILNMPLWEPAQSNSGAAVKQTFYFNYKY